MKSTNTARKQIAKKIVEANVKSSGKLSKKAIKSKTPTKDSSKKTLQGRSLSVSTPKISQTPVSTKPKKTSKNILKEIKYYQNNIGFLVPRACVIRIIRECLNLQLNMLPLHEQFKFSRAGFDIIHETLEDHLVYMMELSYMAARHAKRVTLFPSDIRLINRIMNNK